MDKLNKLFKKIVKNYPQHAARGILPVTEPCQSIGLKRDLLLAYHTACPDVFEDSFACVFIDNKELVTELLCGERSPLADASLINHLWDELGSTIKNEYIDYLHNLEKTECGGEYSDEKYLDTIYRARDMQATVASTY